MELWAAGGIVMANSCCMSVDASLFCPARKPGAEFIKVINCYFDQASALVFLTESGSSADLVTMTKIYDGWLLDSIVEWTAIRPQSVRPLARQHVLLSHPISPIERVLAQLLMCGYKRTCDISERSRTVKIMDLMD
jgi:hypothetical protein